MKNNNLRTKISEECNKKIIYIKSAYLSGSVFLLTTPLALSNINEENMHTVLITLLETGLLTLSITNIRKTISTSKKIQLMKDDLSSEKQILDPTELEESYKYVKDDITDKIKKEVDPKQRKKLVKLKNELNQLESSNQQE